MTGTVRLATPGDAGMIARIHVAAWRETYPGLLPEEEIARRDFAMRLRQWENQIARGGSRIVVAPELGFAQAGPQRDETRAEAWPRELYAIYILEAAKGTGIGAALLEAALADDPGPFTALVLVGNDRALAFYEKTGGRQIGRVADPEDGREELLIGWDGPPTVRGG